MQSSADWGRRSSINNSVFPITFFRLYNFYETSDRFYIFQTLDGRVERDKGGKELRYPVILSAKEKEIARQVALAFKVRIIITGVIS